MSTFLSRKTIEKHLQMYLKLGGFSRKSTQSAFCMIQLSCGEGSLRKWRFFLLLVQRRREETEDIMGSVLEGGFVGRVEVQIFKPTSFLQTIFNMPQKEEESKCHIKIDGKHAEAEEKASNDDDASEKRSLWSRLKHQDITCPKINKTKVITVLVVLAAVALLTSLLAIYVGRRPEVVYISDPITINFAKSWEEIEKYFFNISGITYTGRIDEGRSAASIVRVSQSYNPLARLLQDTKTTNSEPFDQGNRILQTTMPTQTKDGETKNIDTANTWRPFGFIDGLAEDRGLVVRALNPENKIYYIDYEALIRYASQPRTAAYRRLTAHTEGRILEETTQDYFAEVLGKEIAKLEGVDIERIIVEKEEIWVGTLNQDTKEYTISTASAPTTFSSNQTKEQKKRAAQALFDDFLKPTIQEKTLQIQDYGAIIADYFGFSFDRYVDLYVTFEKVTSLGGEVEEEKAETNSTNSTNSTVKRPTPRRPTIIVKAYEAVYGNQPARLKEGKTISRDTFDEIIACVDYNQTTKACTIEEWSNADSPFKISEVSISNQVNLAIQTRYRVSVRPLPADQVVQEPYEKIDPMTYYSRGNDQNDNNQSPKEQVINMQAQSSSPSGSKGT